MTVIHKEISARIIKEKKLNQSNQNVLYINYPLEW